MGILKDKEQFTQLIKALETGWEIDEPVMLGQMWHNSSGHRDGVYHFVLRHKHDDKTTMVSLPPSPKLLVFLHENNININSV